MRPTRAQDDLFQKRLARVKRLCAGRPSPLDRRQLRRCLRLLSLTHEYLRIENPGLASLRQTYRYKISKA